MRRAAILLMLGASGAVHPAAAQPGAVRLGIGQVRADQVLTGGDTVTRSGFGWSLEGAYGRGLATLAVRYLQGSLPSDRPSRDNTSLVEGEAILWVAPFRWVALGVGPHVRAYVEEGGTEHWTMWEVRGRGTALLTDALSAYAELWTVLGSSLPLSGDLSQGLGLEGGLRLTFGKRPFSAQLRYRVNRIALADDRRRETLEYFGIAVGIGRR